MTENSQSSKVPLVTQVLQLFSSTHEINENVTAIIADDEI